MLTFPSRANTECEGTGGAFGRNQNPLASDLTPSAAFSLLLTMPWFSVMHCARAGEGSTQPSRDPQGSFSGPQRLGRDCLMPPTSSFKCSHSQLTRWKTSISIKWVGFGRSNPVILLDTAQPNWDGIASPGPASPRLPEWWIQGVNKSESNGRSLWFHGVYAMAAAAIHNFPCWFFLLCDLNKLKCPLMLLP